MGAVAAPPRPRAGRRRRAARRGPLRLRRRPPGRRRRPLPPAHVRVVPPRPARRARGARGADGRAPRRAGRGGRQAAVPLDGPARQPRAAEPRRAAARRARPARADADAPPRPGHLRAGAVRDRAAVAGGVPVDVRARHGRARPTGRWRRGARSWRRRSRCATTSASTRTGRAEVVPGAPVNAETLVEVEERRGDLAVYRLSPRTGRTHQLRLHLLGPRRPDRRRPALSRRPRRRRSTTSRRPLQLLASELAFIDPVDGTGAALRQPHGGCRSMPEPSGS